MAFIGDWATSFQGYPMDPGNVETGYDTYTDKWDRSYVGCKDAQPEYDGIRDYSGILLSFVHGLIRMPPHNAWAYANLEPMTDPARVDAIIAYDDSYADSMLLPDLRYLGYQPQRRHGWQIEQDDSAPGEDRPVPAILQAAAMLASDTET